MSSSSLFNQNDSIVILGRRGSGKTSIAKFLIKILSDPEYNFRFTILDIVGNLQEFEGAPNVQYYLIDPNDRDGVDMVVDMALKEGNQMVVLDEADRFRHYDTSKLSELVNIGRNFNVGYMTTARRTANIPKDYIVNSNWVVIFKHTWPEDIDRIIEWLNVDEGMIRALRPFEFILVHDTEVIGKYKLNLPEDFTVTSEKPQAGELDIGDGDIEEKAPEEKGGFEPVESDVSQSPEDIATEVDVREKVKDIQGTQEEEKVIWP